MEPISRHELKSQLLLEIQPYLKRNELDKLPNPVDGNSRKSMRMLHEKQVLIREALDDKQKDILAFRQSQMIFGREILLKNKNTKSYFTR